ncbi:5'-nucleotidase C-terminal domain-containing protein [Winogradskyella maritima]|uniref:5'-nucleotidase C-terminal domain-containing protein n=1 Tax=Winogradskyella maritima TaxID=1517766 RepID=A0ABV8AE95_9FLAO|nr:5'-nucleotidase C-terminal domain-containing protein [Winogradskyella maritima]
MLIKRLFPLFIILCIFACKQEVHLNKIKGERLSISDSLVGDPDIEAFIKPFRDHVNNDLDSVIAYAPLTYSKTNGEYNTAIGNFMADAVLQESNPVFKQRTGKDIDMVILNYGGIRSIISKGDITARTAYEVMPFENSVVVVQLPGKQVQLMVDYLRESTKAQPISGMKLTLNSDSTVNEVLIGGEPLNLDKTYHVATNDYLYNGGDRMTFFHPNDSLYVLDYKIRNVLIDYFKKIDTLQPVRDDRFTKLNN